MYSLELEMIQLNQIITKIFINLKFHYLFIH